MPPLVVGLLLSLPHLRIVQQRGLLVLQVLLEDPADGLHHPGHADGVHGQVDEAALVEIGRHPPARGGGKGGRKKEFST